MKILCNEACLAVTPEPENRSNDFINLLHNYREQYYKKNDEAQFQCRLPSKTPTIDGPEISDKDI